jgi:electron transfer flavoprotein beta subunit
MNKLDIWVCFKVQPDFDHVLEEDWAGFGPGSDIGYARHSLNCFDESALEIALRLKDAMVKDGLAVTLGAVTLADSLRPALCRTLFAAGYDEVLRIDARVEFSPRETGRLLAAHLAGKHPDLVLAGKQAGYADTGLTPYYLARGLGLPFPAQAEDVRWDGRRLSAATPSLVIVGNSPVAALRAVPLRQQLAAAKKQPLAIPARAPAVPPPALVRNRPRRSVRMLEAGDLPGVVGQLLSGAAARREQASFTCPGHVLLADHSRAGEAIRYAVEHDLPCVNGAAAISADGKSVIQRVCGSHLEWHIPIGDGEQVWVTPEAHPLRLLLAGGRGVGCEGMGKLRRLASLLGGQAGLTRAAAQNGWGAMDGILGQSGLIAEPELCVAFGASGAAAFMAGVEKARTLVAVNTDPDAPIFNYADYGVIADAGKTLGALLGAFAC